MIVEESVVTEATPVEADQGALGSLTAEQRSEWNKTGELPKSEDAAPSTEPKPKAEAEPAGDSEAPQPQDKQPRPKLTAAERIAEIRSKADKTIRDIRKGAGLPEEETQEAAPSTAKPEPLKIVKKPEEFTRPKPKAEDKDKEGKDKYETYEDFVEDLADWKAEQRDATNQRETAVREQAQRTHAKVDEAKARYENFAEVVGPAVDSFVKDAEIPSVIKAMVDDSDVFADLFYTLASDPAEFAKFVDMAKKTPGKAIRYIALTESLIADELDGKKSATTTEETPVKLVTKAPRPPSEAGGRAASPPDALEAAAKSNDFRAFEAESTRRQLAKLKG